MYIYIYKHNNNNILYIYIYCVYTIIYFWKGLTWFGIPNNVFAHRRTRSTGPWISASPFQPAHPAAPQRSSSWRFEWEDHANTTWSPVETRSETIGQCVFFHGIFSWFITAKLVQIGSISRVHGGYIELVWLVVWNMAFMTFHILGIMINFSEG